MGFFNFILLIIFAYLVYKVFFSSERRSSKKTEFFGKRENPGRGQTENKQDEIDKTIHASDIEDADFKDIE